MGPLQLLTFPPQLSLRDALLIHICAGLLAHYVFKYREPTNGLVIVSLIVVPSLFLGTLFLTHVASAPLAFVASCTAYLGTLVTSIVLYRLSPIHPLAGYPGPLLCKISKLWTVWKINDGKQHLYYQHLHNTYGDAVRVGPNELSFCDPSLVAPMLGTTGFPKGAGRAAAGMYPEVEALIMHRDPIEHAHRRRPWNRAFSTGALKEYQPSIAKRVVQFVDGLAAQKDVVDLASRISWFTFDFMNDMVFGGGSKMMQNGEEDNFWSVLHQGLDAALIYENLPWVPHLLKLLPRGGGSVRKMRAVGISRAKARCENGSKRKDLFYYLSNEDGADKVDPPKGVVVSEGSLAMIAGSDTTVTVLSATFWCLLRHPNAYSRLREEVDKFYPRGEDATRTDHHSKMHYLEAVINEALRLFPALPSGSVRAPVPGGGDRMLGKYCIPDGTNVRTHFWSLQRDPRNFSQPDKFWPDRWLIAEGLLPQRDEEFKHNPNAFIPFSFGPYNCVGKNLALQEMKSVVCHTMQRLDLKFADGWDSLEWERRLKDKFAAEVWQLPVKVKVRH